MKTSWLQLVGAAVAICVLSGLVVIFSGKSTGAVEEEVDTKAPRLVADHSTFSWGTLFQGEEVEHTFKLTNTGGAPVLIKKIKPECGCTVAREEITDRTVNPGETIAVTLNVNTAELKAGRIKKAAEIVSDFHAGDTQLFMTGVVRELFKRKPEKPVLTVVRDKEIASRASLAISLDSNLKSPVEIKKIEAENKMVSVDLRETTAGKYVVEVKSLVDLNADVSVHSETLKLSAEAEGKVVELKVPVSVQLEKRIEVSPFKSIFFKREDTLALKKPDTPLPSKVLEIRSQGGPGHSFKITEVKVEKGLFNARLDTVDDGRRYRLTVELKRPEGKSRRLIRDKVILKTDDAMVPEIKIPGMAQL